MSERAEVSETTLRGDAASTEALPHYRTLANAIDDGLYRLDEEGRFVAVNDGLVEMTGYEREELVGEHVSLLLDDSTTESLLTDPSDRSEEREFTVRTAEGERVRCEVQVSPVEADGAVRGAAGIVRDVTDRRREERRASFLDTLGRELQSLADPDEIGAVTTRLLGEHLNADRCTYAEVEDDRVTVTGDYARDDTASIEGERATFSFGETPLESMRRDQRCVVDDVEADERVAAADRATYERTQTEAVACVPLHEDGQLVAGMAVHQQSPREWQSHEVELVTEVLRRCRESLQRARTTRDLRESEEYLRTLVETTPECIKVVADDGTLVQMNPAGLEMVQADAPSSVVGESVYDLIAPEDREKFVEFNERICRGESGTLEFDIVGLEGRRLHMESHAAPLYTPDGETRQVALTRDITERTEREQALEESERRYRTLAENFPNGAVGVYDRDLRYTLTEGVVLGDALPDSDRLEGNRMSEIFPSDTVSDLEPLFRAAVEDGETGSTTTEFGGRNWRLWAAPLRNADGEIFAGLSLIQDVTEQVERERELEERNERLDSFASMLAHELRNPVAIGQIYGQQLPTDAAPDAVEYVTESFDRIEDMIDIMLVLTRGHEAVGERTRLQLSAVAREAWDQVDAAEATLEASVDGVVQADETYVRHLFRNLLENAAEHGGPDVTVRVGDLPDGFYVADDGVGIPEGDRDEVFETGYTTTAGQGGTGLGLAFVRELADVYEWDCAVTESESGGARFEFTNVDRDA